MLAFEVAEGAGAGEVVGGVGAAVGAVLHVVEGYVALVADGVGAAVAISAVDRLPLIRDAQVRDPGLPEGRAEELDEAGVGELLAVEAFELAVVEEEVAGAARHTCTCRTYFTTRHLKLRLTWSPRSLFNPHLTGYYWSKADCKADCTFT